MYWMMASWSISICHTTLLLGVVVGHARDSPVYECITPALRKPRLLISAPLKRQRHEEYGRLMIDCQHAQSLAIRQQRQAGRARGIG